MSGSPLRIFALLTLLPVSACADLLDIQDAEVDPTLEAATTGASSGTGVDASPLCAGYCDVVMANCQDELMVYKTAEVCLAVCAALPAGTRGDASGNSIECRRRSAELAPAEPGYYCPIAGPSGNGGCGSDCAALCALTTAVCVGDDAQWPSVEDCLTECATVPDLGTYSVSDQANMYVGNHVQCRISHAGAAALADPDKHCRHAAGSAPCAD